MLPWRAAVFCSRCIAVSAVGIIAVGEVDVAPQARRPTLRGKHVYWAAVAVSLSAAIANANAALDAARKAVSDATQIEVDAANASAQSEPAAIAAFTDWLRAQGDAAAVAPATDPTAPTE